LVGRGRRVVCLIISNGNRAGACASIICHLDYPAILPRIMEGFLASWLRAFIIASPNSSSPSDRPLTDGIITVHPITSMVNNVTNKLHRASPSYNFAAGTQVPRLIREPLLQELLYVYGDIPFPEAVAPSLQLPHEQILIPSRLLQHRNIDESNRNAIIDVIVVGIL